MIAPTRRHYFFNRSVSLLTGAALLWCFGASAAWADEADRAGDALEAPVQVAQLATRRQAPDAVAKPNEQAAVGIRQAIERWLLDFLPPGTAGSEQVKLRGQVVVEPFGDRYAVTLPDITINLSGGATIPVGTLSLSLEPQTPVTYAVAMRLPTSLSVLDADGNEIGLFEMGRQRLRGVWDTRFQTMTGLNLSVGTVRYSAMAPNGTMQPRMLISRAELESSAEADERFLLSGPAKLNIDEFEVRDEAGNRQTYFANAVIETELRGLDMINYNRFARRFQGLAQAFIPNAQGDLPDRETSDLLLKQLERELADLPAFVGDAGVAVSITGLVGNDPRNSRGYSMDKLDFTMLARDLDSEISQLQTTYSHRGFTLLPAFQGPAITPGEVSFELDILDIPNADLWQIIVAIPNDISVYGFQPALNFAAEKLYHALAVGNTTIEMNETFINSEELDARATAVAMFDNNAAYKGVAAVNFRLIGMDELMARLSAEADPGAANSLFMMGLELLQRIGSVGDPIAGRSNREYSLRLEANGIVIVNDRVLSTLLDTLFQAPEEEDNPRRR